MVADAERLDESQSLGRQALAVIDPLNGHGDIFRKATLTLNAHGLVIGAGIHQAPAAGITSAAIEVGVAGHDHAGLQTAVIVIDLHNFGCQFMARNTGIGYVSVRPAIRTQVTVADTAVEHFQQCLARLADRFLDVLDFHLSRFLDANCFHFKSLQIQLVFPYFSCISLVSK